MLLLHQPEEVSLSKCFCQWRNEPLSYAHSGGVESPPRQGFIIDLHRIRLGTGAEHYKSACAALDAWEMFPPWAIVHPIDSPQTPGTLVAMVTRICGLWWVNPCRILRRCDSESTHGFVYGTLHEHAECGEEMFVIEKHLDGSVWYVIRAFSRPQHWMAWIGFPLARWWQCRFVRDSQAGMVKKVGETPSLISSP
ncbi:MAG: DUF1990 domain-containing protein [Prosthecobacter sp.]